MGQRTYRVQSSKLGIVIWIILQPVLQFILVLKVTSRLDSFKHGVPSISEQPQPVKRNSSTSCISLSSSVFMEKFTQDASLLSVLLSSSSELLALSRMHDAGAFPAKLYSASALSKSSHILYGQKQSSSGSELSMLITSCHRVTIDVSWCCFVKHKRISMFDRKFLVNVNLYNRSLSCVSSHMLQPDQLLRWQL